MFISNNDYVSNHSIDQMKRIDEKIKSMPWIERVPYFDENKHIQYKTVIHRQNGDQTITTYKSNGTKKSRSIDEAVRMLTNGQDIDKAVDMIVDAVTDNMEPVQDYAEQYKQHHNLKDYEGIYREHVEKAGEEYVAQVVDKPKKVADKKPQPKPVKKKKHQHKSCEPIFTDKQIAKHNAKAEVEKKFRIGDTIYLREKSKIGGKSNRKEFEVKKVIYAINEQPVNILILKQTYGSHNMIYTVNQIDCHKFHIKYEPGLQVWPMKLNWNIKQKEQ